MDWDKVKALKVYLPVSVLSIALLGALLTILILCTSRSQNMSVDVFGRHLNASLHTGSRGPPGEGFKKTTNGHFDLDGRKLRNVGDPEEDQDGATLGAVRVIVDNRISSLRQNIAQLRQDYDQFKIAHESEINKIRTDVRNIQHNIQSLRELVNIQRDIIQEIQRKMHDSDD